MNDVVGFRKKMGNSEYIFVLFLNKKKKQHVVSTPINNTCFNGIVCLSIFKLIIRLWDQKIITIY